MRCKPYNRCYFCDKKKGSSRTLFDGVIFRNCCTACYEKAINKIKEEKKEEERK